MRNAYSHAFQKLPVQHFSMMVKDILTICRVLKRHEKYPFLEKLEETISMIIYRRERLASGRQHLAVEDDVLATIAHQLELPVFLKPKAKYP